MTPQYSTRLPVAPVAPPPSRHTTLAPFIVCADAHVYHLAEEDAEGNTLRTSICGQVEQHPAGGRYRSGRRKPQGSWSTPRYYRCCSVCSTIAQARDQAELSEEARIMRSLTAIARDRTDDELWPAAKYDGNHPIRLIARAVAVAELNRRLREQTGRKAVA